MVWNAAQMFFHRRDANGMPGATAVKVKRNLDTIESEMQNEKTDP